MDSVGFWLGLPQSKRDDIMSNYHNATQRKYAFIDAYVNDHPCPQWRLVSSALHCVDLNHEADVVERTYVQGTINYIVAVDLSVTDVSSVGMVHTCASLSSLVSFTGTAQ